MTVRIVDGNAHEGPGPGSSPTIFDSPDAPADPQSLVELEGGLRGADLAAPPVVLPDFHHKANMEMPSSIAVATRGTIRPTLTSASVNCGMALIALDLERPSVVAVADFYRRVRERYPYPRNARRDLTAGEVLRCAVEGGDFAVDRFGVDAVDIDRVEERGRLDLEPYGGADRLRKTLPWLVVQLSRMRFGNIGPSNHFVELQEVEELIDPPLAVSLGLQTGRVTLQFHGGGGVLAGEVGNLFGARKHRPLPLQAQMSVQKPLFHLASARSIEELSRRWSLYFTKASPSIPLDGAEGRRVMLANAAAMNYGFAFRLATYSSLREMARRAFGPHASRLIVDSPHNSMYEEQVGGRPAVVHRHNSCRAYPASRLVGHPAFAETGQPLLLPGTNRTSSYVCVAAEGAAKSLFSACHGSGMIIEHFERRGRSGAAPRRRITQRFRYSDAAPIEVPQLDDRGVDEALRILVSNGLVRPVARLRPFAVLN